MLGEERANGEEDEWKQTKKKQNSKMKTLMVIGKNKERLRRRRNSKW